MQRCTIQEESRNGVGIISQVFGLTFVFAILLMVGGCTRRFYREKVDKEVEAVLQQKDVYPDWKIENYHVYPDPRARFSDPTDPDRPPMPPDDPAARELSPTPQKPGKAGIAYIEGNGYLDLLRDWDARNRTERAAREAAQGGGGKTREASPSVEGKSTARDYGSKDNETTPPGFLLKLEQASELGLINSREFQDRREDLYLTALPVTLERFAFAPQFFFLEEAIRERTGRFTDDGYHNRWRFNTDTGFTKLFSTGALLVLQFANRTVVELTGQFPRHTISVSTLNLDLVQPFLRGGGKAVTLEGLTQAERNLVYEIRSYARFRKEFFVFIAAGRGLTAAERLFGGFAQGRLVVRGTPLTPAVLAGTGRIDLTTGTIAEAEGYLPTLLRAGQLINEEKNVASLGGILDLFQKLEEDGRISPLQVGQVNVDLLRSRSTVLQRRQDFRDSLDRFKVQLGLPPTIPLELDTEPIRDVEEHLRKYEQVHADYRTAVELFAAGAKRSKDKGPEASVEELRHLARRIASTSPLVQETRFKNTILPRWEAWERCNNRALELGIMNLHQERKEILKRKRELKEGQELPRQEQLRLQKLEADIELGELERAFRKYRIIGRRPAWEKLDDRGVAQQLTRNLQEAAQLLGQGEKITAEEMRRLEILREEIEVGRLEDDLRKELEQLKDLQEAQKKRLAEETRRREKDRRFKAISDGFSLVLVEPRNERLEKLRVTWPELLPARLGNLDLLTSDLEVVQELAVKTALEQRLDLMNARARLVDAWRQVTVFANSLLGVFNVGYHLDVTTPGNEAKPLNFQSSRTRNQVILNTELPLVRVGERNNYRAALIAFQRQRRALMAAEDTIATIVRSEVRLLRLLAENYKIQQEVIHLAYSQVENARELISAPPDPTQLARGPSAAGNEAALTRQLLDAQGRLVQGQNTLYAVWINYQIARLQLYLDLELMQLDERGVWIDEHHFLSHHRHPAPTGGRAGSDQQPAPELSPPPRPVNSADFQPAGRSGAERQPQPQLPRPVLSFEAPSGLDG